MIIVLQKKRVSGKRFFALSNGEQQEAAVKAILSEALISARRFDCFYNQSSILLTGRASNGYKLSPVENTLTTTRWRRRVGEGENDAKLGLDTSSIKGYKHIRAIKKYTLLLRYFFFTNHQAYSSPVRLVFHDTKEKKQRSTHEKQNRKRN